MSKKSFILLTTVAVICVILSFTSITLSVRTNVLIKNSDKKNKTVEGELEIAREDIKKYEYLLDNFNNILLKTIFYGRAESEKGETGHSFTAFSLFYKEKFYLITAGHGVELGGVKFKNFKFKPNFGDIWLTPELLYYENDLKNNNDFAIFQDDFILKGLYPAEDNLEPEFIVGNTSRNANIIKEYDEDISAVYGESGSPVLNSECRVVGVLIKNKGEYTDIAKVLIALEEIFKD